MKPKNMNKSLSHLLKSFGRSLVAAALPLLGSPVAQAADVIQARLTVQAEAAGPRIDPDMYGQFAEHLGAGVYGGLWVGPGSAIPNVRGWRKDVVQALRRLEVPVVRWPGGCFADDYDWRDGIGNPKKRPVRPNRWWGGVAETNRVGTHEFMDLTEQLGAEAFIAGNMGSMSAHQMSQWMEYMTADGHSTLADERRRNGRAKPWKVKYFGIGNESWGCGGNMRPEYQSDLHNQYATFLGGGTKRVASGDGTGNDHLIEVLMERSMNHMDALTLHYYTMSGTWEKKGSALGFDAERWARTLQAAKGIEGRISTIKSLMDKRDPDKRVALYVDEWGTWHDVEPGTNPGFLYQQNTLRDAMVAAVSLDVFHRHTDRVRMTNIAQMVNVLQAMVLTDGPRMLLTPTYHVFDMYKPFKGATPLKAEVQSGSFKRGDIELTAVEASVARSADGKTVIALVNLDPDRPARVATNLKGAVQGTLLTAAAMDAHNSFAQPNAVAPVPYGAAPRDGALSFELPPKSIVVVTATP
jgi:alpha-L-arabinofuranosidase